MYGPRQIRSGVLRLLCMTASFAAVLPSNGQAQEVGSQCCGHLCMVDPCASTVNGARPVAAVSAPGLVRGRSEA